MGKPKKVIAGRLKQRNPKNKRNKTHLVFDEKARVDWLTGFRKRKNERRKKAHEEIIETLKEEKRQLKKKKREEKEERLKNFKLNDIEAIARSIKAPKSYDLPAHTVTVTDMTEVDFGSTGTMLGLNQDDEEEEEESTPAAQNADRNSDSDEETSESYKTTSTKKRKFNPKKHVNYSHTMHNTKVPKNVKKTKEFRAKMKRKEAKRNKRKNH